jgi:hypothetical protein
MKTSNGLRLSPLFVVCQKTLLYWGDLTVSGRLGPSFPVPPPCLPPEAADTGEGRGNSVKMPSTRAEARG